MLDIRKNELLHNSFANEMHKMNIRQLKQIRL